MRAYDLSMILIFTCCGFAIIGAMGIHNSTVDEGTGILSSIATTFTTPVITVAGVGISGVMALAGAMALATVVVLQSNVITDRGIAMIAFATIFWGAFGIASMSIFGIITKYPGFTIFWTIFLLASGLIFVMAMVQFPVGGQGASV